MKTLCHKQLCFESLFSKKVIADLEGGQITSDAGGLLLREVDQRNQIAEKAPPVCTTIDILTRLNTISSP